MSVPHFAQVLLYNFGFVIRANLLFSRHLGHSCGTGNTNFRSKLSSPLTILYPLPQLAHSTTSFNIESFVLTMVSGKSTDFIVAKYIGFSISSQEYPSLIACSLVFGKKRIALDLL